VTALTDITGSYDDEGHSQPRSHCGRQDVGASIRRGEAAPTVAGNRSCANSRLSREASKVIARRSAWLSTPVVPRAGLRDLRNAWRKRQQQEID
jgi:hypothetical protein